MSDSKERLAERAAKKAPTLKDVAAIAGVSPFTVSAVLNGARSNTQVSDATRRRIVESAASINYYPNAAARSLARRETRTLGILFGVLQPVEAMANAYASALLHGIMIESANYHYNILLFTEPWVDAERSAPAFRDRRTDGIALIAPLTDTDMLPALAALPLSLVAISPDPAACPADVPSVDVDNIAGIQLAVKHLTNLGHTRIAHLMGDANVASVAIRHQAFVEAMAAADLSMPAEFIVRCHYNASGVDEALARLLALPNRPTAIVAGNDNIALAVIGAARANGISIPEELSVVGFDDVPAARQVTPTLTTIRQPLVEIGRATVRLLLANIEPAKYPEMAEHLQQPLLIAPELIVRDSTAAPRLV